MVTLNWRCQGPTPCFIKDAAGDPGEAYPASTQQNFFSGFQSSVSTVWTGIPDPFSEVC